MRRRRDEGSGNGEATRGHVRGAGTGRGLVREPETRQVPHPALQPCGKAFFYPRPLCVHCGSADWAWIDASGKGTVYSTSVVRQRPEDGPDYNIALIDLAEGPRMMSRVTDLPAPEVKIGMAVEAYIAPLDKEPLVLFRPAGRA